MAYPTGGFTPEVQAITALAGYKAAFTTNRGTDRYNIDLFELDRVHVNNCDRGLRFGMSVSGYYNLTRQLKPSH